MASIEPSTIDVERERGITVTWSDDHVSRFTLEELRVNCPCAKCRDVRGAGQEPWPGGTLSITTAEMVGNWGLNVTWNDGHSTGIYSWETLRLWCPCDECEASS